MRRLFHFVLAVCLFMPVAALQRPAAAAPPGYAEAAQDFDQRFSVGSRILTQILLIAGGYTNAVPLERFTPRLFTAIRDFQIDNGFTADGIIKKAEVDRLIAAGSVKLNLWNFRKIGFSNSRYAIWAPTGLGLVRSETPSGLHFKDPHGRLTVHMLTLTDKAARALYDGILAEARNEGTKVNYSVFKDSEDWFVISSTARDGRDRYYRYHQDGANVTGFALEWNNANGNVNAERIAVIMSGSLRAAMTGAPYIDPPAPEAEVQAAPPPPVQAPAAVPIAPPPPSTPKVTVSTGTGFFVSEEGHFVTNAHVVQGCKAIRVKTDDNAISDGTLVATDAQNDLAVLKLAKKPLRVAALRSGARLGEGVEAFGFPHSDMLSSGGNFTRGDITALSGMQDDSRYLQISVPVQSGNSGGPLLDTSGNLVGVVSSKLNAVKVMLASGDLPQNVNFAVKSGMVANFLDSNRIAYKTGTPGKAMEPADIADQARAMSGFVVCR